MDVKITLKIYPRQNYDVYKGKDCMEQLCEFLREHAMEITNFKKKKMKLLTNEQ